MAGEHVGEESDGERQGPGDQDADELDDETSGRTAFGTPGGMVEFGMYLMPWYLKPTTQ